jgi:hypothetical protein
MDAPWKRRSGSEILFQGGSPMGAGAPPLNRALSTVAIVWRPECLQQERAEPRAVEEIRAIRAIEEMLADRRVVS